MNTTDFSELIWDMTRQHYRDMPWRRDVRPYYILVSELMLQQTQVDRVIPKFDAFITRFPDEKTLADAPLSDVLQLWSGLGYNRRARFLHEAARHIIQDYAGRFPTDPQDLLALPGVGKNTAGALQTYAFNEFAPFIETNVRTVYIHHFFEDEPAVNDSQIMTKLIETVDREHPREFYWALMDYGSWLKRQGLGRLSQSKHYKKQSPLKGSVREIRGQLLKALHSSTLTYDQLAARVTYDERFDQALTGLITDKLVVYRDGMYKLMD